MAFLGAITGQVRLDVRQAVAAYAILRAQNARTVYALRGTGDAFIGAGKVMGAVGIGMVAVFAKAVSAAAEFERKMDYFGAVTGATTAEMDRLGAHTLKLAEDTIYSANEIADGYIELGKAGVSARQIIAGIGEAMANLGAAGDIPLAESAQIITSTIQQFDLSARDAVEVVDLLAGAANASIADITDIGYSLKYVGGVANAAGLKFEDTATAISLLAKAGIRGSTAGTSLRQMIVSFPGATGPAQEALEELGIITKDGSNKFYDMQGNLKPLNQVFQILQRSTADLTNKQRLMYLRVIFNNRALSAAAILTREGAKGFDKMNEAMRKVKAADVAAQRLDNLSGDIEILKGNIETLLIEQGSPFQEWLRGIVQDITKLVRAFNELDPATQKLIFTFLGAGGAALIFMGAIAIVIGTVARFIQSMIRLKEAFGFLGKSGGGSSKKGILGTLGKGLKVGGWIGALLLIKDGFTKLTDEVKEFDAVWEASKKGFDLGGGGQIKALIAGFKEAQRQQKKFYKEGGTGEGVGDFFGDVKGKAKAAFAGVGSRVQTQWDNIKTGAQNMIDQVVSFFQRLPGRIGSAVAGIASRVKNAFTFKNLGAAVGTALSGVVKLFVVLPAKIMGAVGRFSGRVISAFGRIGERIAYWVGFGLGRAARFFIISAPKFIAAAGRIIDGIGKWFQQLPGKLARWVASAVARAIAFFGRLREQLPQIAAKAVTGVVGFVQQLPGRMAALFARTVSTATQWLSRLPERARAAGRDMLSGFQGAISGLPGVVNGVVGNMISAFTGAIGRAYDAAKNMAGGLWKGFKDGLGISSPSFIERAAFTITDVLQDETKKMAYQVRDIQRLSKNLGSMQVVAGSDSGVSRLAQLANAQARNAARAEKLAGSQGRQGDRARGARSNSSRLVGGELDITPRGRAFIRGVAQDTYNDNADFDDSVRRG